MSNYWMRTPHTVLTIDPNFVPSAGWPTEDEQAARDAALRIAAGAYRAAHDDYETVAAEMMSAHGRLNADEYEALLARWHVAYTRHDDAHRALLAAALGLPASCDEAVADAG